MTRINVLICRRRTALLALAVFVMVVLATPIFAAPNPINQCEVLITVSANVGAEVSFLPIVNTIGPPDNDPPIILTGNVTDARGETVIRRGFVWSREKHDDPGNIDPIETEYEMWWNEQGEFTEGAFTTAPVALVEKTDYYGRAFAETSEGISYGNEVEFDPTTRIGMIILTTTAPVVMAAGVALSIITKNPVVALGGLVGSVAIYFIGSAILSVI